MPLDLGERIERVAKQIVDAMFRVHKELGPGLLASVYQLCLAHELQKRGLQVEREVRLPVIYDGITLEAGLKIDLLVEGLVIIEIKSVEQMHKVFEAQLLTYMKLAKMRLGFLVNFNVPLIKDGIKRLVL
jgi:GxxExxY protein